MQKKSFSRFLTDNIGFLFIVPWLIGFLVFKVYPFASSLYYSFTNYDWNYKDRIDELSENLYGRGYCPCLCSNI